jgi:hypothetical protein
MYMASKRQLWPVFSVVVSTSRIGTGAWRRGILDVRVEAALESLRLDQQVAHRDAAASPRPVAPRVRVEALLVQLADAVGARVGRHRHLEVLQRIRPGGSPHVRGRGLAVLALDRLHDLDVVAVRELAVGFRLEQVLDVEVVERAHDRPARDGRDHLDRPQEPELREPRKDADMKKAARCPPPERARPSFGCPGSSVTGGASDHTPVVGGGLLARGGDCAARDLTHEGHDTGWERMKKLAAHGPPGVPTPSPSRPPTRRIRGNLVGTAQMPTGRPRRGGR